MNKPLLVITGANGQVASFLAKALAEQFCLLLLYHQRTERLDAFPASDSVFIRQCDVTKLSELRSIFSDIAILHKLTPTYLIHCLSLRSADALPLCDTDARIWQKVFETNTISTYNILKACLPSMQRLGFGRIVLFGSTVATTGLPNGSAYAAAKAAIVNMVKSVAIENAKFNILINSISPAPIATNMAADFSGEYLEFREKYFSEYIAKVPTGKLVAMEEILTVVKLLLDPMIANLTGQDIVINGGLF